MTLHARIVFFPFMVIFAGTFCAGDTDPLDAINSLYVAMRSPPLQGWKPVGGDPCLELWQGVDCVFSNITAIRLGGMNLSGELGIKLGFPSIIEMDLSNNQIGGVIPSILPPTLRNLSLSGNQLTGSILDTLSSLTQLSLSNNHLNGKIPDVFQQLTGLMNMDLSSNNLSGQLPPSMGNMSSLTTLHLQNNQLSGYLNVLQDLHLQDLNIENNLFFGPIPPKLLGIPNFRTIGNPFNTTIIPSPPAAAPSPVAMAPSSEEAQAPWSAGSSPHIFIAPMHDTTKKSFLKAKIIIWIAVAGFSILIALMLCLVMLRCFKRRPARKVVKGHDVGLYSHSGHLPKTRCSESSFEANNQEEKVPTERVFATATGNEGLELNNRGLRSKLSPLQPPPNHLPIIPGENVTIDPSNHTEITGRQVTTSCIKVYSIASLRQYTNSFSQENYIGEGTLGPVYRAELPDGKLLAVRKLDSTASKGQNHEQFLQLVSSISKIQHVNVVKLLGYCAEFDQRLLVYEYCSNGTLHDALHTDNELHSKLSWNSRIQVALGTARALEYLHEKFQPPIVHRNFRSANVLLNDKLEVCVSDCGLGPLLSSGSTGQLSGRILSAYGYSAPEFESGSYTQQSDVFSFGVVMLELLTGRQSYDRSRPRGEQFLVRWAVPQLHDIDALSKMVDPYLNGAYPMKALSRLADIILSCVQREPEFRPAMSEIVQDLLRMM